MSAANVGEKNIFKLDEDEGDEVRYCHEKRMYDSFSIHFLFCSYSCVGLFFPINYALEWTKNAIRSQEEGTLAIVHRGMCGLIYVRFARGFNRMHQKTSQNGQYCQNSYGLNGILQYS